MPSLWWENQPLVAVEAMINGIPVIGSDRGGLPEALGNSGVVLPLPVRLTPYSRELPTTEEVTPWVEAVIRLWDDTDWYTELRRRALAESRRWEPVILELRYARFFTDVRAGSKVPAQVGQRHATRDKSRVQSSFLVRLGSSGALGRHHRGESPSRPPPNQGGGDSSVADASPGVDKSLAP